MRNKRTSAAVVALVGAVLTLANGCSFVLNAESTQCQSDGDCAAFEGTFCSDKKTCVSNLDYCFSNAGCIDRNGSETFVCRKTDHRCVNLLTRECPKLLADKGDLRNDNAVVFGSLWMPSWNATLQAGEDGIELARQDFKRTQGGLPSTSADGVARPLVVVACDIPFSDQNSFSTAIDHLVDDVQVPAMVGPLLPDWSAYAVRRGVEKGVVIASPDPAYKGFASVQGRVGIFFSNGVPSQATPLAQALLTGVVETKLRAATPPLNRNLRVAFLNPGSGSEVEDANTFLASARFNGKSALENGADYLQLAIGELADDSESADFASALVKLQQFKPDVIACIGGGRCYLLPERVEALLPDNSVHYLMPYQAQVPALATYVNGKENLRTRVLGVIPGRSQTDIRLAEYYARFRSSSEVPPVPVAAATFDLTYALAFAAGALPASTPLTGAAMGQQLLTRFKPGGFTAKASPTDILAAFGAIKNVNVPLSLDGTTGGLEFDDQGFVKDVDMQVWCISKTQTPQSQFAESGVSYHVASNTLSGTNTCF